MTTRTFDLICTTADAAKVLKLSDRRVKEICAEGLLECKKHGSEWVITTVSVRRLAKRRSAKRRLAKRQS